MVLMKFCQWKKTSIARELWRTKHMFRYLERVSRKSNGPIRITILDSILFVKLKARRNKSNIEGLTM